jgi:site-specific DNA recombinase
MASAAIYVRVSTSRQAERDLSLPDQVAQCRAYCERQGWKVAEIYTEPGASALDEDRPVFQEMIYKATRSDHPFEYVVIHSLSRFSRDALHSELYVRKLRKAGVELVSITQAVTPDASGEMFRKRLNFFDEHQSRENVKHVHRAMLENARQGFWNGARAPFGYNTEVAERRGNKDKKVLVVNEDEARTVRHIFGMATCVNGHPVGVKAIASHLNERGILRRGHRCSTGGVHDILTSTTYFGCHYFNRTDSRNGTPRPPSQWIELRVPPIIDEATFNAAQGLLKSRGPKRMPPRVANGPTFLAGLARRGHCGAALIQNTGKGGTYRYYCCSRKLKEGPTACQGMRIRMDKLDGIVIGEVAKRVLEPERLTEMLQSYVKAASEREGARSRIWSG